MDSSPYLNDWMDQAMANLPPQAREWLMNFPPQERMAIIGGVALGILVIFGLIAGAIASSKGRNAFGWFFVGFFFTVLGIIVAAVMPSLRRDRDGAPVQVVHTGYAPPPNYGRESVGGSAADEIAKAKQLLDDGAISQGEFESMKAKALRRG